MPCKGNAIARRRSLGSIDDPRRRRPLPALDVPRMALPIPEKLCTLRYAAGAWHYADGQGAAVLVVHDDVGDRS